MANPGSGDDSDVLPTGFPNLAGLELHEHSPPSLPDHGQHSSIPPPGVSGDVIPEFQNIALQERSPSPLPHRQHRSFDFPAEPSVHRIEPHTEQSGHISDPDFNLPPPAYGHTRGNRPRAGQHTTRRGDRRGRSAPPWGHSGPDSYSGIHRQFPSQRGRNSALTTMVRRRLRASGQRSTPTGDPAAASHHASEQAATSGGSPFGLAWEGDDPDDRWSRTGAARQQSATPEGDVRRRHLFRTSYYRADPCSLLTVPSPSSLPRPLVHRLML